MDAEFWRLFGEDGFAMRFLDKTERSRSVVKAGVGGVVDRVGNKKDFAEVEERKWMKPWFSNERTKANTKPVK